MRKAEGRECGQRPSATPPVIHGDYWLVTIRAVFSASRVRRVADVALLDPDIVVVTIPIIRPSHPSSPPWFCRFGGGK
jgi:hypothetical protein